MRSLFLQAIVMAANANALNPRIASAPRPGTRHNLSLIGILSDKNAAVLNNTSRFTFCGCRTANPIPIAPPQSWTTRVIFFSPSLSTKDSKLSIC